MSSVDAPSLTPRRALAAIGLLCSLMLGACGASSTPHATRPSSNTAPNNASPPKTATARPLRPSAPTGLRPGTPVSSGFTGVRVFADHRIGFAITNLPQAGDGTYPVATSD